MSTAVDPGVRCALMRGGTSKGVVLLAEDLPDQAADRDELLLRLMGSPDPRQVDGLGGAHPLTSKVAVVSRSGDDGADVDYLFLQVGVEQATVSTSQTCGNMLAAVAPFAIERGLVDADDDVTTVRVRLLNTGSLATVEVRTPGRRVTYDGDAEITGVPGTAAPILITSAAPDVALLPTGTVRESIAGLDVTCIDQGMPSVLIRAKDVGVTGAETPEELEADAALTETVAQVRAEAAARMGLIDAARHDAESAEATLARMSTPKIVLLAPPAAPGGTICTRSFIPTRVHQAIGVLGAASVAAAVVLPGSVAAELAELPPRPELPAPDGRVEAPDGDPTLRVEHPTGHLDVRVQTTSDPQRPVRSTSFVRTARLLFDGVAHPGPRRTADHDPSIKDPS